MISIRTSKERGEADHGWLKSRHTFSFGSYFDPKHTKFRSLRVINEDWIKGGEGFGAHPHQNMEIITYIIDGAVEHKDDLGNTSIIRRGEAQRMTAGTGVSHSEHNPGTEDAHLLQIWIQPERADLEPGYEQRDFTDRRAPNTLTLIASQCGKNDSLVVRQDVELFLGLLNSGKQIEHALAPNRRAWLQMISGELILNGVDLAAGDGAAIQDETLLTLAASIDSEFLLFDLA